MPVATDITLPCGPTTRVRIEILTKSTGQDISQPRKFGEKIDIPMQRIAGVHSIMFDDDVGGEQEKWVDMEKGLDVGKLIREHTEQKKEIAELKRRANQYESRLATLQINEIEVQSKPAAVPKTGKREVVNAQQEA